MDALGKAAAWPPHSKKASMEWRLIGGLSRAASDCGVGRVRRANVNSEAGVATAGGVGASYSVESRLVGGFRRKWRVFWGNACRSTEMKISREMLFAGLLGAALTIAPGAAFAQHGGGGGAHGGGGGGAFWRRKHGRRRWAVLRARRVRRAIRREVRHRVIRMAERVRGIRLTQDQAALRGKGATTTATATGATSTAHRCGNDESEFDAVHGECDRSTCERDCADAAANV